MPHIRVRRRSGTIDLSELQQIAIDLGEPLSEEELVEVMVRLTWSTATRCCIFVDTLLGQGMLDTDGNGSIDYDEFIEFLTCNSMG